MSTLKILIKRNIKLFFKDKGTFLTSLITPVILLILYATFLGKIYKDSFLLSIPEGVTLSERILGGLVGGQLVSSILAVSCITVAFCSNFLMVQDKATGTIRDLSVTPVKGSVLSLSYYIASFVSTMIICGVAAVICLAYVAVIGWCLSVLDILLLFLDILLLVSFGTAISSVINYFLSSQGQISAVGTMVSSCYGFISGAYMPLSQFSEGLRTVISFLPGTYGTSLLRNHAMQGAFAMMKEEGFADEIIEEMKTAVDCNLFFFDHKVSILGMYAIMITSILVLVVAYVLINRFSKKR